ncbi:Hypothetical protein DPCES_0953 [Desulfitobacterium hafniense]|uniref:Uncharacterized protein n=1 Tax=Desulfitobacterium hafniense TaxID=49338 RepID=A0A098AXJ7_DESHA|nr:hypothetical protein [Desulfitobacterium hafniense]CDX00840.1 Hypothetical protein DPCES_0953 [Desulfitobacterium hafniense]
MYEHLNESQYPGFVITERRLIGDGSLKKGILLFSLDGNTYFIYADSVNQKLTLRIDELPEWKLEVISPYADIDINDFLTHNNDRVLSYASQWIIWGEYPKEPRFRW